jgi:anti-sigma regulatory factor (Ser/Thr protein kinase)
MCLVNTSTFPCHSTTPQRAREFSHRCLREVLPGNQVAFDTIDGCLLVVSELATNAVTAGRTVVNMTVEIHRDHVRVAAYDDGPGMPRPVSAGASDRQGRGLAIVDSLSRAWGVWPQPHGKQVWADVPIPSELVFAVDCRL